MGYWTEINAKELRDAFREFKRSLSDADSALIRNMNFSVSFNTFKREVLQIIARDSHNADYTFGFLKRVCEHLITASTGKSSKESAAKLLQEVNNFLSDPKLSFDPMDMWPDGPGTDFGICWICGNECNIRWLADPLDPEPLERKPWCQKCHKTRRRKES